MTTMPTAAMPSAPTVAAAVATMIGPVERVAIMPTIAVIRGTIISAAAIILDEFNWSGLVPLQPPWRMLSD